MYSLLAYSKSAPRSHWALTVLKTLSTRGWRQIQRTQEVQMSAPAERLGWGVVTYCSNSKSCITLKFKVVPNRTVVYWLAVGLTKRAVSWLIMVPALWVKSGSVGGKAPGGRPSARIPGDMNVTIRTSVSFFFLLQSFYWWIGKKNVVGFGWRQMVALNIEAVADDGLYIEVLMM